MIKLYWKKGLKQKGLILFVALILLVVLFFFRDDLQPIFLFFRKYIFIFLLSFVVLFFGVKTVLFSGGFIKRIITLIAMLLFFVTLYVVGFKMDFYNYVTSYNVFKQMTKVEIAELPSTQNERVQPLRNILAMATESVGETKDVSLPHLVKVDSVNKWTMAIQPSEKYIMQRLNDNTEELFAVSSTTPFPRFSSKNRVEVTFAIGESLKFSRNSKNAVIQRFNLWQLFNYEPSDVYYMKNDSGNWVQVVSLIKWEGFFFPYPSFGGVVVIESGKHDFKDYLERVTFGKGKFIAAKDIKRYPFLKHQNILSERVSRAQAESLKFLGGFTDPLPWNMKTAVKIPQLSGDQNQQPFVTDFKLTESNKNAYDGLHHWFGLEPIGSKRTSLAFSVFIPANGTSKLYYYNHAAKKEGYAGVSAMPLKVIESRKEIDWSVNKPVEFRPYIKDLAGRKRLMFLGTVSSVKPDNGSFDGSATPDLALIDSEYRDVVWVDAKHPSQWEKQLYDQLNEAWRASEGIGHYFQDDVKTIERAQFIIDSLNKMNAVNKQEAVLKNLQRQMDSIKALSTK